MIEEMLMKELMKTAAHTRRPVRPNGEGRGCGKNRAECVKAENGENVRPEGFGPGCGKPHVHGRPGEAGFKPHMGAHFHLLDLLKTDEGISQQAIADKLEIRPQSVSEALARLEEHGLIRREESSDDKRVSLIYLSDKGDEQRKAFGEARAAHAAAFFSPLTDDEKQTLLALLSKLNAVKDAE